MTTDDPFDSIIKSGGIREINAIWIFVSAAFVALFLSLCFVSAFVAKRLAPTFDARLAGQITVVVWGRDLESADAASARAAELLAAQPGVRRVTVMDADESDDALGRLVAGHDVGAGLPRLLSLRGTPAVSNLRAALAASHLTAALDDHHGWERFLGRGGASLAMPSLALGFCLCGVLFTIGFIRGSRAPNCSNGRFDLMRRLGADPTLIAGIIARRSAAWAFGGGVAATLCADVVVFGTLSGHSVWSRLRIPTIFQPLLPDAIWTLTCPLVVAGVVGIASGLGAWREIVRQERNA